MFCGECGAKIKKNADFCSECGAKVTKKKDDEEEIVEEAKPRKPMSKGKKIGLIALLIVVVAGIVGFNMLSEKFGPEGVAKEYIEALKSNDVDKIYDTLNLDGDTTFVSKDAFKEVFDTNDNKYASITNYTVSEVTYSDGNLQATVKVKFTTKDSSSEDTININLLKKDSKKLLLFDDWEVSSNSASKLGVSIVSDYQIKVPKNATVSLNDTKLDSKYLSSDKSTSELDTYVIPQIFESTVTIKTTLESGIEITGEEDISSYNSSYTASVSLNALSDDMTTKLQEQVKSDLTTLYKNIMDKKDWATVKESYSYNNVNLSDLQDEYVDLYEDIAENENKTLTKFEVTNVTLTSVKLNSNGKLVVSAKYSYSYTIDYKSGDTTKTHEGKSSSSTTITYDYFENAYKMYNIDGTVSYFSTW